MNTPLLNSLLAEKFGYCNSISDEVYWLNGIKTALAGIENANQYEHGNTAMQELQGARAAFEGLLQAVGRGYLTCSNCGAMWDCTNNKCTDC